MDFRDRHGQERFISEGHPFDYAQGRLSGSRPFGSAQDRQRGFPPLHTPYLIKWLLFQDGSNGHAPAGKVVFGIAYRVFAEMKYAGRQNGVGLAGIEGLI